MEGLVAESARQTAWWLLWEGMGQMLWEPRRKNMADLAWGMLESFAEAVAIKLGFEGWEVSVYQADEGRSIPDREQYVRGRGMFVVGKKSMCSWGVKCVRKEQWRIK